MPHGRQDFTRHAWRNVANDCVAGSCREIKVALKLKTAKQQGVTRASDSGPLKKKGPKRDHPIVAWVENENDLEQIVQKVRTKTFHHIRQGQYIPGIGIRTRHHRPPMPERFRNLTRSLQQYIREALHYAINHGASH